MSLLVPGSFRASGIGDTIKVGTGHLPVKGRGTRLLKRALDFKDVTGAKQDTRDLELTNVALIEGFHVNIIAEMLLFKLGIWVCGFNATLRKGPPKDSKVVRKLERQANLTFFKYKPLSSYLTVPSCNAVIVHPTLKRRIRKPYRRSRDYHIPRDDEAWL
jgi:hypothetical protein